MFMVKRIGLLLLLCLYFVIAYAVLNYYDVSCVFLTFLGIPCPGCGMTRALISIFNMDIIGAIKHNVVIFFMPYVFTYILFEFKHKIHNIFLLIVAGIAIINWLIKIILYI